MNSLGFNKKNKDTKVVVAMSGGVDSSVVATMLKKEDYDVTGITLKLYSQSNVNKSKSCCAGQDIEDAKKVAEQFNFPHFTYDYQDRFFSGVIDNFVETYAKGKLQSHALIVIKQLNLQTFFKKLKIWMPIL